MKSAGIVGTGLYLPEEVRTNDWFKEFEMLPVDTIFDEAGVLERRVIGANERPSDMEAEALKSAVSNAGIDISDVEMILVASVIPDQVAPGNAASVQYKSGARNAASMDVECGCVSLIAQINVADALIKAEKYKTVACVVSSAYTIASDLTEKNCMFLGDGAAAVIMQPVSETRGILGVHMETDGSCHGAIGVNRRLPRALMETYTPPVHYEEPREKIYFYVDHGSKGLEVVRKLGPTKPPEVILKALANAGLEKGDIDFLITHNPSKILTEAWRKALDVPLEKTYITIEKYGNMAPVSIGANLHEANIKGLIHEDDIVAIGGPGAGYHFCAAVLRWGK